MQFDPSRVPEGTSILLQFIFFSYICGRVVRIDPLMKEETRTPFPTTFCSGLQKTGKMKTIPLTQGKFALVDDEDYDYINQWKWYLDKGTRKKEYPYASRNKIKSEGGKRGVVKMHRVIMNTPADMVVDHIDHNGLNNQKYNMRNCYPDQNAKNSTGYGESSYLGVSFDHRKKRKKVRAQICVEGKSIGLGYYLTEEDAARAYDRGARHYFGEFANLNFKD